MSRLIETMLPYLTAALGCLLLALCLTYGAKNWDDPPDWWPNCLQPKWSRRTNPRRLPGGWDEQVDDAKL